MPALTRIGTLTIVQLSIGGLFICLFAKTVSAAEPRDILVGVIDPFNEPQQRRLFLRAAGIDTEIDREEFLAKQERLGSFIQSYDNWESLRGFDGNRNGTIDWFEMRSYRLQLREAILRRFDKNRDDHLLGEERIATLKWIERPLPLLPQNALEKNARGVVQVALDKRNPENKAKVLTNRQIQKLIERTSDRLQQAEKTDAPESQVQNLRKLLDTLKRVKTIEELRIHTMDYDGDGVVSAAERDQHRQIIYEDALEKHLKEYDQNVNGMIDAIEYRRYIEHRNSIDQRAFDSDRSGILDDNELKSWRQSESFARWAMFDKCDVDNNGLLNPDEQKELAYLIVKDALGPSASKDKIIF